MFEEIETIKWFLNVNDILCFSCLNKIQFLYDNLNSNLIEEFSINLNQEEEKIQENVKINAEYFQCLSKILNKNNGQAASTLIENSNNSNLKLNSLSSNQLIILNELYEKTQISKSLVFIFDYLNYNINNNSSNSGKINKISQSLRFLYNIKNEENHSFLTKEEDSKYSTEIVKTLERWPISIIFIGGIICLGFSALFHLFTAQSKLVKQIFNRMDYAGIAILIVCSCYPPYYYFYYCNFSKFLNLYYFS